MLIGGHVRGLACAAQCQAVPPPLAYTAVLAEFAMQVEQDALTIRAEGFMDIDYNLLMSVGVVCSSCSKNIYSQLTYFCRSSRPWLPI